MHSDRLTHRRRSSDGARRSSRKNIHTAYRTAPHRKASQGLPGNKMWLPQHITKLSSNSHHTPGPTAGGHRFLEKTPNPPHREKQLPTNARRNRLIATPCCLTHCILMGSHTQNPSTENERHQLERSHARLHLLENAKGPVVSMTITGLALVPGRSLNKQRSARFTGMAKAKHHTYTYTRWELALTPKQTGASHRLELKSADTTAQNTHSTAR